MADGGPGILVVGGLAEDVRAVDAGVRDLGLSVAWVEPAEAAGHLDAFDALAVVLDLDPAGLELAAALRGRDRTRNTPLLFLADPDVPPKERARALGFPPADCLTRPPAPEAVRERAELVLELRRQAEWAQTAGGDSPDLAAALREGEARVSTLGDHLPDGAIYQVVQSPDGGRKFTYISAGVERLLGVRPAEVLADPNALYGLILPDDLPTVIETEVRAAAAMKPFDCQFRQRTRDGQVKWVRCRSAPRRVGALMVWDGLVTDETAARMAADALRESEERYRVLADLAPLIVWVARPDGSLSYCNQRWTDYTGLGLAESAGDAWVAAVRPDHRDAVLGVWRRAVAEGSVYEVEVPLRRASDGAYRWHLVRGRPQRDAAGDVVQWVGAALDIDERARAEAARRESEERFRLMADAAPVFVWIAGPDKKCLWFNKGWLDFTGRALAQEVGDGWADVVHPDDLRRVVQAYHEAFDARRPYALEYRLRRHDGAYRWLLDHGVPLSGPDGAFTGYIGSCIDITDQKEVEDALRAAARRKEDYLVMLAHELRNPLAPIRNGLHVLGRRSDDPRIITQVREMMSRQVENMARIVDDLLDVSRVARGKVTLRKTRLDLADVARTCAEDRRAVAEGGGLKLTFAAPDGPVWVDADATRLSQVLDNLIHNAVKFTPAGGEVSVTATGEGDWAAVRVRDTGIGIDPPTLAHLFEVFTQADRSLERSRGGLGLGLALVKGLAELHGGAVTAHSEGAGKGSEFTVRLPRAPEPQALTELPASPSSAGKRRRVLVVEDNPDSAESLRMLLDLSGFEVQVAHSGPAGVEAAHRFLPHVVVCDIGLPGLDGYGVAAELRKAPTTAAARLIAVTGYGRPEDVEKARRAGFDRHLTKPVDPYDLLDHLSAPIPAKGKGEPAA